MKKKFLLVFSPLLLSACLLSACHGGGGDEPKGSGESASYPAGKDDFGSGDDSVDAYIGKGDVFDPKAAHHVEGTVHEDKSKDSDKTFLTIGGTSEWKIVADSKNSFASRGAEFLRSHVLSSTRVDLPLLQDSDLTGLESDGKYIYFGCDALRSESTLPAKASDLGAGGYELKAYHDSVFLSAGGEEGYRLGTLKLLQKLLGFDTMRLNQYVYTKVEGATSLPWIDFDVKEIADYTYRSNPGYSTDDYRYAMGLSDSFLISDASNWPWIHNVYTIMKKYRADHPEWFDDKSLPDPSTGLPVYQLCYLAHGDAESRKLMVQAAADEMWKMIVAHPNQHVITFTAEDTTAYCECDACKVSIQKYRTEAGSIIQFLNEVDDIIQAKIKDTTRTDLDVIPTDHEINILTFAYHNTVQGPAYQDASGEFKPIDESVVMHPHVGVMIAPSYAKYTHTFYEDENKAIADQIRSWGAVTNNIYGYTYATNFRGYLYPYDCFEATLENLRFFKEQGAHYFFDSTCWEDRVLPAFKELQKYLNAKGMIDVNVDANTLTDRFFTYTFRAAAPIMKSLFQAERNHLMENSDFTGAINDDHVFDNPNLWPAGKMLKWEEMCEQAKEVARKAYQETNPELCETVLENITIESITPRFAMLTLHPDYYDSDTLYALRKQLKEDFTAYSFSHYREHDNGLLSTLYTTWGV